MSVRYTSNVLVEPENTNISVDTEVDTESIEYAFINQDTRYKSLVWVRFKGPVGKVMAVVIFNHGCDAVGLKFVPFAQTRWQQGIRQLLKLVWIKTGG